MLHCISWGKLCRNGVNVVGICRAFRLQPLQGPRSTAGGWGWGWMARRGSSWCWPSEVHTEPHPALSSSGSSQQPLRIGYYWLFPREDLTSSTVALNVAGVWHQFFFLYKSPYETGSPFCRYRNRDWWCNLPEVTQLAASMEVCKLFRPGCKNFRLCGTRGQIKDTQVLI